METERERLERWCGEPCERFAERLEHAARMCWRMAYEQPDRRKEMLRVSRNLGIAAAEFRAA